MKHDRPLGTKVYQSIPHLPGSRMGPADRHIDDNSARVCTERVRDQRDVVIVQEKLDGSNVCVARAAGKLLALTRSGYLAEDSPHLQHRMFAAWVADNLERFDLVLEEDGQRLCGEWLALAHGTRYALPHEPFVAFDLFRAPGLDSRAPFHAFLRAVDGIFVTPRVLRIGAPISIDDVVAQLEPSGHGALDPVEGAVWRVERKTKGAYAFNFAAKWVRLEKQDGCYLPSKGGGPEYWNWRPGSDFMARVKGKEAA